MPKTLTSTVHHLVGLRFVGETPEGQRVMIDNEKHARTGMSPMQLLLNATAACAAMDVVVMLGKRKLPINAYRIELVGERPDAVPAPFERIVAKHVLDVPGLDLATAERFVQLATDKYCSVGLSLRAEIVCEVELVGEGVVG
jgi:putative redox protein